MAAAEFADKFKVGPRRATPSARYRGQIVSESVHAISEGTR
jgi:hypothetical protein